MKRSVAAAAAVAVAAAAAWYALDARRAAQTAAAANAAAERSALAALDTQLAKLEADVADMNVYQGIWENELRYTRGLDRHDESLMAKVFWPEASISYGSSVTVAELPAWANAGHSNSAAHQHHVTGLTLDVAGDTAHEEGYILYSSDMPRNKAADTPGAPTPGRAAPKAMATLGTGRYVNRYERRNGEWRLIVHEYVHDISMRLEAVDLCATGCLGRWDTTDISYLRPLQPLTVDERRARAELGKTPHGGG
jgi:hypothetical protein